MLEEEGDNERKERVLVGRQERAGEERHQEIPGPALGAYLEHVPEKGAGVGLAYVRVQPHGVQARHEIGDSK